MALDHYDFSRTQTTGASMLNVHASFVEIVSVNLSQQKTSYSPKRATSANKVNTGQAQVKPGFLKSITNLFNK
jgi:hypothetical protein